MLRLSFALLFLPAVVCESSPAAEPARPYVDHFRQGSLDGRSAVRGDWKIADGMARCTQDDELYKKNKDHGPVVWYKAPFQDATVKFSFQPEACKTFVFTINGDNGHVFRFVSTTTATNTLVFPTDSAEHKSQALDRAGPALKQGEWTDVVVEFKGREAALRIGPDFSTKVDHAATPQPKTTVGLGFSFGSLSVKDFSITP
jgi:hypothetical protein